MSVVPVDPSFATGGAEWNISGVGSATGSSSPAGGFGQMLGNQIQNVANAQTDAAGQSQALADGTATDPSDVVMSVERAQLEMQMATTFRNKGVEAIQEIMRTQV
ncbi:MAG: flagellar hook-basal body complex protein FliE [Solirubrobacteraceae bacterium]|nr:flagellar hook-basal body complex protein FliE [Patulibacter sp.]